MLLLLELIIDVSYFLKGKFIAGLDLFISEPLLLFILLLQSASLPFNLIVDFFLQLSLQLND